MASVARKSSLKILKYHDLPIHLFFSLRSVSSFSPSFFSSVGNAASYSSIFNPSPLLLPAPPTTHRTLHHTRTRVYRIRDACRLHATAREATAVCKTRVDPSSSPYFPAGNGVNNTEIYLFTGINHRELYG